MERKTGTASMNEKKSFTHRKSVEAKRHDNHALKEQQQGSNAPRKKRPAPCTENRKNKPMKHERQTSPLQRGKCLRWYDF
jgi:hypothetical protein